jgi:glycosidase
MATPEWVKDAIFYQIFPDRFYNGDTTNDPENVKPWENGPTVEGFQGGDLQGIQKKLDYLQNLGISAIYMTPIFLAASTHRYDTMDYLRIDPKLGDLADFHKLVDQAHQREIRIILDGVFNHCGRGFFAFNDILENGKNSPYLNWFYIDRIPLDAYTPGDAASYKGWWKLKSLPKLNYQNRHVRDYTLGVAKYWLEQGIDGWRLDVPNEVDDDSFWAEFRDTVKSTRDDSYILGEIWDVNPRWVGDTHFDGLMNYPFRAAINHWLLEGGSVMDFKEQIEAVVNAYPRENLLSMYNTLGSHDTERIATLYKGNVDRIKLALDLLFILPGAPAIYYGDEIGLPGGKDPLCRKTFPWDESLWNYELWNWVKNLITLRKERVSLRQGEVTLFLLPHPDTMAVMRSTSNENTILFVNASNQPTRVVVPEQFRNGIEFKDLMDHNQIETVDGKVFAMMRPVSSLMMAADAIK